jgi:hypothetical protein
MDNLLELREKRKKEESKKETLETKPRKKLVKITIQ